MSDEPLLPALPVHSRNLAGPGVNQGSKKRPLGTLHRQSSSAFNSSDSAVFSSDDDPGLDNYVEGRHKKRYKGSWFRQLPMSSDSTFSDNEKTPKLKKKRTLARQNDSGVYVGSDTGDDEDLAERLATPISWKLPQLQKKVLARRFGNSQENEVREKIRSAIDLGEEAIDLWGMNLTDISNDAISLLSQFAPVPTVTKGVAFEQKRPEMRLYLARNQLTRVPGALFDISFLTVLSLRNNELTELPSGIGRLHHLQDLNVAQNKLHCLPIELLDLVKGLRKLRSLVVQPNPFFQPDLVDFPDHADLGSLEELEPKTAEISTIEGSVFPRFWTVHIASSPVQCSNTSGRVLSDFHIPTELTESSVTIPTISKAGESNEDSPKSKVPQVRASRVPSLMEMALLSCYKTADLPLMPSVMPSELGHLSDMLERSLRQREVGGYVCSKCRKTIIQPTLEWIEWRRLFNVRPVKKSERANVEHIVVPDSASPDEIAIPFLHRACSWLCGP